MPFPAMLHILRIDPRGAQRRRRRNQHIHVLQNPRILLLDQPLRLQRLGVMLPQHELPPQRPVQHIRPVIRPPLPQHRLMRHERVGHRRQPHRPDIPHHRQIHRQRHRPQFLQRPNRLPRRRPHRRLQIIEIVIRRHPHPQPRRPQPQRRRVIRHRHRHRAGIQRIMPRHRLEQQRAVGHRPRHRPDMIPVIAGHQKPPLAYPPESLLQPHHPAKRPRQPHRPAQIRPQRRESHPRRHIRPPAAAGAARNMLRSPRIPHRPIMRIIRCRPRRELLQVFLAQNHRPRRPTAPHRLRILRRHIIRQNLAPHRSANPRRRQIILNPDRNALQRPLILPPRHRPFLLPRLRQSLLPQQGNKGIQRRLQNLRPLQRRLRHLHRRNLAPPNPRRQLRNAKRQQPRTRHNDSPPSKVNSPENDDWINYPASAPHRANNSPENDDLDQLRRPRPPSRQQLARKR